MTNQQSLNSEFLNNLSINTSTSARDIYLLVSNTDNTTGTANASLYLESAGAAGGNPYVNLTNSIVNFSIGQDNADSDNFKISASNAPGTTTVFDCDISNGGIIKPLQPAFSAYKSANASNVSGNGSTYSVVFDVELFDIGSNYNNGNGYFTAPKTGIYYFASSVLFSGCTNANACQNIISDSGGNGGYVQYGRGSSSQDIGAYCYVINDMTVGDTVHVNTIVYGEASDICDLYGTQVSTWFCGILLV